MVDLEITVVHDPNLYTPLGVYVNEQTYKWVAAQVGTLRCMGCYRSVEEAFKHMAPAGLIPHCRLMRSEKYNEESNVFAGIKFWFPED